MNQNIALEREHYLLGFMTDEEVQACANSSARIAGQEYAQAQACFARRHERSYGPTGWRSLARYRLLTVRNKRAVAALCVAELLRRAADALTAGALIRQWWNEYCHVLARGGSLDRLRAITKELEARGVVQEGRPMPTTGCKDLADECERLKRARNTGK